jgi:predicted class III extradiol MEMO1 family dioxygenase
MIKRERVGVQVQEQVQVQIEIQIQVQILVRVQLPLLVHVEEQAQGKILPLTQSKQTKEEKTDRRKGLNSPTLCT